MTNAKTVVLAVIRATALVAEAPEATLRQWAVYQLPNSTRHFCGWCEHVGRCRVSSPIVAMDAASASAVTSSGRRYRLSGPPATEPRSRAFWRAWLRANSVPACDAVDVTAEIWTAIRRTQGLRPRRSGPSK